MHAKKMFYCTAAFTRADEAGELLSIALISPDGRWYYAEVIDYEDASVDETARQKVLPVLMRVPDAEFTHTLAQMEEGVANFLAASGPEPLLLRCFAADGQTDRIVSAVRHAVAGLGFQLEFDDCQVDPNLSEVFFERCGGRHRVMDNAYILALHAGICDAERTGPSKIHEIPIIQVELLMGSKNAMSYRAWARGLERDRSEGRPARAA